MNYLKTQLKTRELMFMAILIIASVPVGLMFSMNLFNASIIWPTTAFAFVFLFLWKRRVALPVFVFIFIGYVISHLFNADHALGMNLLMSLMLTVSDFSGAAFGAWLVFKLKVMLSLKFRDIMFGLFAFIAMTVVSTIIGNLSLLTLGLLSFADIWESMLIWFLGDFFGLLIFGLPLVMSLQVDKQPMFKDFNWKEALFYGVVILFTFFFFRGDIPHISFVFHKYLFIPFAIIIAFFFPIRTIYVFSLIFLILMYITEPFILDPNIFIYMSEVNFLLIILTAVVITLKLVMLKIESSKATQLKRQKRLNTLVDALKELFNISNDPSILEGGLEHEASRVFRLIARIIGGIDYGSCAVIEGNRVRFIDALGFDVKTLNQYNVSADDWIKDLKKPERFVATRKAFDSKKDYTLEKAFENKTLDRIRESVFMSVRLSGNMTCELSFDIDKDSDASFSEETMAYFEGLNILLETFFEASQTTLDTTQQTNSMVVALLRAIDLFDPSTRKHSERVASIALSLAKMYGMNEYSANTLFWAGIVHDIGKIGLDWNILNKKDALTIREYETVKTHPQRGWDLLVQSSTLKNIAEYVLHHHERYDGTGYPDQLNGKENLKESSILAVAESIAAMHEDRPYSPSLDKDAIIAELREEAGHQFDPEIAGLAAEAIKEGLLESLRKRTDH